MKRRWTSPDGQAVLICGDARRALATIPSASVVARVKAYQRQASKEAA